jgi:hypothetical protein
MPTHDTTELSLAFPVAALGMSTGAASLTGVGRSDKRNRHTCKLRLTVSRSLRFPNRRPRANVPQLFQRNRPLRVFGFRNKLFCNVVVRILLKPALLASQLSQVAFGREAPVLLQTPAQLSVPAALAFNTQPTVPLTIRVGCQVDDA